MLTKFKNDVCPHHAPRAASLFAAAGAARRLTAVGLATGLAVLSGCTTDSFLDPSVNGRWEPTPTIMPILDRLASIEDDTGDLVETTEPVEADLIPLPQSYRIGPGDNLDVTLYDLIETNRPEVYQPTVDPRGAIELPQLGRINVSGLTTEEATEVIRTAMKRLVADPLVLVVARGQRQQTFNIIGEVQSPGPYFIPRADYRILEALTSGGRFDESLDEVFIIRQIPLTDEVTRGQNTGESAQPSTAPPPARSGDDLLNMIDQIAPAKPGQPANPAIPSGDANPTDQPMQPGAAPAIPLPGEPMREPSQPATRPTDSGPAPVIDLPGNARSPQAEPAAPMPSTSAQEGSWIFVNGKWTRAVRTTRPGETPGAVMPQLITQRIIRIPIKQLLAGRQSVNVIVRPGDVIRVPAPPSGLVYVTGQVARPGPYQFPSSGGLTLMRALDSAGGLGSIAIPERIDLTRILDKNRQATILLNGRAISRQTQPDVWLKPNDRINVGTNFWALPLAVVRNGFRASYGFGFVLDRNISNDIFGPPPVNAFGQ